MAVIDIQNANLTFGKVPLGIQVTKVTDTSADWPSVANNTYFYDKGDGLLHYKDSGGTVLELFSAAGGLTYFTEAQNTAAPNNTVYVDSLTAVSTTTNADFAIVPKGTGAIVAQVPDGTVTNGNKRGAYAVDLQMSRTAASQVASGTAAVIIGGTRNTSNGFLTAVVGGQSNTASNYRSAVVGGINNTATGFGGSYIFGGENNVANANYSSTISARYGVASNQSSIVIGGGTASGGGAIAAGRSALASGTESIAIMGIFNTSSGYRSAVISGASNTASASYSSIIGGRCNTASGLSSSVSGGYKNLVQGFQSSIGGGNCNNICNSTSGCLAIGATVAGGVGNNTTGGTWTLASCAFTVSPTICNAGQFSTVGGGFQNIARGSYAVIAGGCCNTSSVYEGSFIGGGWRNSTGGVQSVVAGGRQNTASGTWSTIGGGRVNTASGIDSATLSGAYNTASSYSTVAGGQSNTSSNNRAFIGGGQGNIASGSFSTVPGGYFNKATGYASTASGYNTTASGYHATAIGSWSWTQGIVARFSHASGRFSSCGDSQRSNFVIRAATTDATATTMTMGGVASTINQVILGNQSAYSFVGTIVGKQSGSTNAAMWKIEGLIVRGANAASTVVTTSTVTLVSNAPGWGTPTLAADTTNGGLQVQVTGAVGTNIQWTSSIETTEVIYA